MSNTAERIAKELILWFSVILAFIVIGKVTPELLRQQLYIVALGLAFISVMLVVALLICRVLRPVSMHTRDVAIIASTITWMITVFGCLGYFLMNLDSMSPDTIMQFLAIGFAIVGLSMIFMFASFRLRVNEDESY